MFFENVFINCLKRLLVKRKIKGKIKVLREIKALLLLALYFIY